MTHYTPGFLASLSDGMLANYMCDAVDMHFGQDSHPEIMALRAEIKRRGLSQDDLHAAQDDLELQLQMPLFG